MSPKRKTTSPLLAAAYRSKTARTNTLNILDIGNDALLARVHLIRSARISIDIQTFIWKKDDVGLKVLKELYDAARRGVQVRLLIDFWIFHEENEIIQFLNVNHKNFEVKFYNPPVEKVRADALEMLEKTLVDFKGLNQRMHNKVFLIDGALAIVGGRNYDNTYYDRGKTRNFIDLDIMASGPVVKDVVKVFTLFWRHKLSFDCNHFKDIKDNSLKNCAEILDKESSSIKKSIFTRLDCQADDQKLIRGKFSAGSFKSKNVEFIYDKPGKVSKKDPGKLSVTARRLQQLIAGAQNSIIVQSPYFVLSRGATKLLKQIREKRPGLDIVVSTNSLAATDNLYAYAILHKEKKVYIKDLKIRIFELKPIPRDLPDFMEKDLLMQNFKRKKTFSFLNDNGTIQHESKFLCIHSKIFIIDNDLLWAGTFNADVRSEMINTEMALIIKSKKAAGLVKDKVKKICAPQNSWTVAPKKYIPVLTEINDELTSLSNALPLVDLWPFRNVTCFELKKDASPVAIFHKDFYNRYTVAGTFPQISTRLKEKEIKIRLLKTFGKFVKPLV